MSAPQPDERFARIYRAHLGDILAFLRRRVPEQGMAEEVAQETFLVVWRRLDEVPDPPLPWLYGVARHLLQNARRGAQRRSALHDAIERETLVRPGALGAQVEVVPSDDRVLMDALARLGPDEREVLMLIAWEGLTQRDASGVMVWNESKFARRFKRAQARLEAELAQLGAGRARPPRQPLRDEEGGVEG